MMSSFGRGQQRLTDAQHLVEEFLAVANRHALHLRAGNHATVLMDRIGRRRREHDIALIEHREREMRDTFLGADRDDRLGVGIEFDAVAALVPVADRQPELIDAARNRVAMVGIFRGGFDQFGDDMRRRRLVGITHPEIDNILAGAPRLQAQFANRVEYVRR